MKQLFIILAILSFTSLSQSQTFEESTIQEVIQKDSNGKSLSIGKSVSLTGTVYTINFRPKPNAILDTKGLDITLLDDNNNGIKVYINQGYLPFVPTIGDNITVKGKINEIYDLTTLVIEIDFSMNVNPDHLILNSSGNLLINPLEISSNFLNENTENKYIKLCNLSYQSHKTINTGTIFSMRNTNGDYSIFIHNACQIEKTKLQNSEIVYDIIGVSREVENSTTLNYPEKYYLCPSVNENIISHTKTSLQPTYSEKMVKFYPISNRNELHYESQKNIDRLLIYSSIGQVKINKKINNLEGFINISSLEEGYYFITFIISDTKYTMNFIK